jgi:hypothetical protein
LTALFLRLTATAGRAAGSAERTLGATTAASATTPARRRPTRATARTTTPGSSAPCAPTTGGRAAATGTRCTGCTGCTPQLTSALLRHHRWIGSWHAGQPWTTTWRLAAASWGPRCCRPAAVGTGTRRARLTHSLRRGKRVIARTRGSRTPSSRARSSRKSSGGTGTGPRRGSLAWGARHSWAWNRRRLRQNRRLSCRCRRCSWRCLRSRRSWRSWCGGCRRCCGLGYWHLSGHLNSSRCSCGRLAVDLLGGRLLRCCLLGWRRLASQLLLETSFDRRLNGGGGGSYELPHVLQHAEDDLAFDSELFRKLVDTDLCHCSPCWRSGSRFPDQLVVDHAH